MIRFLHIIGLILCVTFLFGEPHTIYEPFCNEMPSEVINVNSSNTRSYRQTRYNYKASGQVTTTRNPHGLINFNKEDSRPSTGMQTKVVREASILDLFNRDVWSGKGTIVTNENGQSVLITREDYDAYKSDQAYKDWIDSGGIANYETYQEYYATPLIFDTYSIIFLFIICMVYIKFFNKHEQKR